MKKTYLYMIGCAAALVLASCAKDTTVDNGGNLVRPISINAHIAEPSRTTLGEDEGGIRQVLWEEGDKCAIIDDFKVARALEIDPGCVGVDGYGYTLFAGDAVVDFVKNAYPIVYPYSVVESGSADAVNVTLPEVQTRIEGGESLMVGFTYSGDNSLSFDMTAVELYNLVGYLDLQVVGEGTVSKVTVTSASQKLSGAAVVTPSYEGPAEMVVSGANYVELIPAEAVTLSSEPTSFLVSLPAGTYPAGDLTVVFETSNGMVECVSSQEHVLAASVIKPLTMSATSSIEYVNLTEAEKYANSFIVSGAGWYSFEAKTRGGYVAVPHPKTGETMLNIGGENAQACNAWESADGMIKHVKYNAATNVISFYHDGQKGNSMISIVEDGKAEWNWHIWCTDKPADQQIGNNLYMDRNLGAWNTPANVDEAHDFLNRDDNLPGQGKSAVGLMWQWGRPVPLPGVGRYHLRGPGKEGWYQRETNGAVTFANLNVEKGETITATYSDQRAKCGSTGHYFFPSADVMGALYKVSVAQTFIDTDGKSNYVEWTNRWNLRNNTTNTTMAVAINEPMLAPGTGAFNTAETAPIKYWCNDLFADSFDFGSAYSPWNYGANATVGKTFDVCPYGYHVADGGEAVADFGTLTFTWRTRYNNGATSSDGLPGKDTTTRTTGAYATAADGSFVWIPCSSARVFYGGVADCGTINWWCASNDNQEVAIQWAGDADASKIAVVKAGFYDKNGFEAGDISETSASLALATRCVKDK